MLSPTRFSRLPSSTPEPPPCPSPEPRSSPSPWSSPLPGATLRRTPPSIRSSSRRSSRAARPSSASHRLSGRHAQGHRRHRHRPPGKETGWHTHAVPLFAYVLKGEFSVDYGAKGVKVYKPGDSLLEAMNWPHNGTNKGPSRCRSSPSTWAPRARQRRARPPRRPPGTAIGWPHPPAPPCTRRAGSITFRASRLSARRSPWPPRFPVPLPSVFVILVGDAPLRLRHQHHPDLRAAGEGGVERGAQPVPAPRRPHSQPRRDGEGLRQAGADGADRGGRSARQGDAELHTSRRRPHRSGEVQEIPGGAGPARRRARRG